LLILERMRRHVFATVRRRNLVRRRLIVCSSCRRLRRALPVRSLAFVRALTVRWKLPIHRAHHTGELRQQLRRRHPAAGHPPLKHQPLAALHLSVGTIAMARSLWLTICWICPNELKPRISFNITATHSDRSFVVTVQCECLFHVLHHGSLLLWNSCVWYNSCCVSYWHYRLLNLWWYGIMGKLL